MSQTADIPPYSFGPVATDLLGKRVQYRIGLGSSAVLHEGIVRAIVPHCGKYGELSLRLWVLGSLSQFVDSGSIVRVL